MEYPHSSPVGVTQPWTPPAQQPGRARSWMAPAALVAALAALAVGGAALVQGRAHEHVLAVTPATAAAGDTEAADRALCAAISPLMGEDDKRSNAFIDSGPPGSPERDAGLLKYRSDTEDWAARLQGVLDGHTTTDPFFKRTLQRYIDDRLLLVRNMRPGPPKKYDEQIWSDSLSAYGGPLYVCGKLGIEWA